MDEPPASRGPTESGAAPRRFADVGPLREPELPPPAVLSRRGAPPGRRHPDHDGRPPASRAPSPDLAAGSPDLRRVRSLQGHRRDHGGRAPPPPPQPHDLPSPPALFLPG